MKNFKDCEGRSWDVAVNVDAIRRVRDALKVNLLSVVEQDSTLMADLQTDPVLLVDVLYVLCKPQADERAVTDAQFGRAMAGDAIEDATAALLEGIADFFPKARRLLMQKVLTTTRAYADKMIDRAGARLDHAIASGEMDREIDRLMEKALTDSAGDSPGSSASTPPP